MSATPAETSVVEHEVRIAARPETVFAFFTDPAKMVQWMGAEATLDPRPGGVCRIAFQPSRQRVESLSDAFGGQRERARELLETNRVGVMSGEFVEVDPHRRIVLTWGWEDELLAVPPQSTAVEVAFIADGDGTIVRLAHRRLPAAAVAFHEAGWQHYLPRLVIAAAGWNPEPDPWQAGAGAG
jgi:uncharacterized protein YndB with AHSA1/START domain